MPHRRTKTSPRYRSFAGGDVLFLPSINFLFLMGLIEYHPKTDAIEYVGPNEAL